MKAHVMREAARDKTRSEVFTVWSTPTAREAFRTHYLSCEKLPSEISEINQGVKHLLKTSLEIIGERSGLKGQRKLGQLVSVPFSGCV